MSEKASVPKHKRVPGLSFEPSVLLVQKVLRSAYMAKEEAKPTMGIQEEIIEGFLKQLRTDGTSSSVVERIGKVVISKNVSEGTIKKAIFPDESEQ